MDAPKCQEKVINQPGYQEKGMLKCFVSGRCTFCAILGREYLCIPYTLGFEKRKHHLHMGKDSRIGYEPPDVVADLETGCSRS